ncbi:MAG: energy-coupling factor ABC transporter ATP-binding protein [Treponema sp.]|jgi:biotin transport system ATP-binding protein|nr:energy-coupling factor ABC transporter ATP-binding protein [Treponema sp.]
MHSETEALFSLRKVSKVFSGGTRVLGGIDLDIYAGECLLLAGSNGSGKTVLIRILTGLLEPSEGEVLFHGQPLNRITGELRRSVGLVFQDADAQFIGETAEEDVAFGPANLGFPKGEIPERVTAALEAVGLQDRRTVHPRRLSGGEKRRLATAGILAMGCDTVILDEPFANLDWPGVIQTLEIIRYLKEGGKTVIILTHELEKVLAFADRLVILHRGSIRDDGRPEAVIERLKPEYGVRDPRGRCDTVGDCTWL